MNSRSRRKCLAGAPMLKALLVGGKPQDAAALANAMADIAPSAVKSASVRMAGNFVSTSISIRLRRHDTIFAFAIPCAASEP